MHPYIGVSACALENIKISLLETELQVASFPVVSVIVGNLLVPNSPFWRYKDLVLHKLGTGQ